MLLRHWRPIVLVFLPFAAGYYLSYLFRTINALISGRLIEDLGFDASHLGLMTSVYFLAFALVQLPLGVMLDRHGPRRVQSGLLLVAAAGAALFARADHFTTQSGCCHGWAGEACSRSWPWRRPQLPQ